MNKQSIAVFGAEGEVSQSLIEEALKRGHSVTAIVTDRTEFKLRHPNLVIECSKVKSSEIVSRFAKGHDTVIAFYELTPENTDKYLNAMSAYLNGTKDSLASHLIVISHSYTLNLGTLQHAFELGKAIVQAEHLVLDLFRKEEELKWSYIIRSEPEKVASDNEIQLNADVLIYHSQGEHRIKPKSLISELFSEVEKDIFKLQ